MKIKAYSADVSAAKSTVLKLTNSLLYCFKRTSIQVTIASLARCPPPTPASLYFFLLKMSLLIFLRSINQRKSKKIV